MFVILSSVSVAIVSAQRGSYAGQRPGTFTTPSTTGSNVQDRFGETGSTISGVTSTTQRLPYDAYGDAYGVQLGLSKPQDHQPFWLLNQGVIEAHRGGENRPPSNSIANRFGETNAGAFDSTSINKISQPEIVYPVNVPAPAPQGQNILQPSPIFPTLRPANQQAVQQQLLFGQPPQFDQPPQQPPQQPIQRQLRPIRSNDDRAEEDFFNIAPYFSEFDY